MCVKLIFIVVKKKENKKLACNSIPTRFNFISFSPSFPKKRLKRVHFYGNNGIELKKKRKIIFVLFKTIKAKAKVQ